MIIIFKKKKLYTLHVITYNDYFFVITTALNIGFIVFWIGSYDVEGKFVWVEHCLYHGKQQIDVP